jgi:signal transduction histidine kinase/CheY-like chemotaxis protein
MNGGVSNISSTNTDLYVRQQVKTYSAQQSTNAELLEAVFNTSTLGIHVLESLRNESGQIIDFSIRLTNTMSEKIAGRKVTGMRMLEGWPHTKEIGLFDRFIATVETGVPVDYEQYYEADGVRAWFRWLASKLNDGLYVTIEDITHRKTDEEALETTANKLQSLFDGVPVIIALLDVQFDNNAPCGFLVSSGNKPMAKFSKCTVEDLIGKNITNVYPEAFRGELLESYLQVFRTGEPLNTEFFYPGINRWFSIHVTKRVDSKGLVVVAIDVTDKKAIQEEKTRIEVLTKMDKLKSEFFSNVSHELRTPLTLLLAPLEEVLASKSLARTQLNKVQMAHRNAVRLQKLVNSLLDFARIESGKLDTVFQPTDLCEFTQQLASNFQSVFEKANLKFKVSCDRGEQVYVNRIMWEKIVFNLLSNALKFTFKGHVELRLKSLKHNFQLHVIDSGEGISYENLDKIFDRFVRVENVRARTFEGSGIGLALVKELVTMHGGTIKVKSKLGEGSEFIVSIPKGKKHLPAKMIHELDDADYESRLSKAFALEVDGWMPGSVKHYGQKKPTTEKPIVLLIDDNRDLRDYISSILHFQFEVIQASNGKNAVGLINEGLRPDLIPDIMMPEMNGYELLKAVKENAVTSNVPFVFLSAKASEEEKIQGLVSGAADYLIKPFSATDLSAIVDSRIKAYRKQNLRNIDNEFKTLLK